jgi:hypothetical protein
MECWSVLQSKYTSVRQLIARRLLENELSSIIRTAAGHKRNKVTRGAPQYQALWEVADTKVQKFCDEFHCDRSLIEAQVPALKELESLAQTPEPPKRAIKTVVGILFGTVSVVTLGFLTGIFHWLFTLGYSLAPHFMR